MSTTVVTRLDHENKIFIIAIFSNLFNSVVFNFASEPEMMEFFNQKFYLNEKNEYQINLKSIGIMV